MRAEELREAERARSETLAEIERLAACRDRLASLVGVVRSTIEDAGEQAAGIGDRVDEAVAPLTDAIEELSVRLAAFAELAALPGEDTWEPASERSLNLVELEEQDDAEPGTEGPVPPRKGSSPPHHPRSIKHSRWAPNDLPADPLLFGAGPDEGPPDPARSSNVPGGAVARTGARCLNRLEAAHIILAPRKPSRSGGGLHPWPT